MAELKLITTQQLRGHGVPEENIQAMQAAMVAKTFERMRAPFTIEKVAKYSGLAEVEVRNIMAAPWFAKYCARKMATYSAAAILPAVNTLVDLLQSNSESIRLRAASAIVTTHATLSKIEVGDEKEANLEEAIKRIEAKVKDARDREDRTTTASAGEDPDRGGSSPDG